MLIAIPHDLTTVNSTTVGTGSGVFPQKDALIQLDISRHDVL